MRRTNNPSSSANNEVDGFATRRRNTVIQSLRNAILVLFWAMVATPARAATLDPLQNIIDEIVTFITGPGGIAIGTIVVAGAGLGAAMGRLEWRTFFMTFVGLVMVFGAATIVEGIVSTAGGT